MTTSHVSLCYIEPDWQIQIRPPCAANRHQYDIRIDGVAILVAEHLFPRFLHDLRDHLDKVLSDRKLTAEKERMTHVPGVRG